MTGAKLEGAILRHALLRNTNLSDAKLLGALLDDVDLSLANLSGAEVTRRLENLQGVIGKTLQEHREWMVTNGRRGQRGDLSSIDLRRCPTMSESVEIATR